MTVKIIFQDANWLIVDKPADWLSVPSRLGDQDQRPCLGRILEKDLKLRLWPVHRLDFEVSGLVVMAKTAEAHRRANAWFSSRQLKKTYEAYSEGPVEPVEMQWQRWKSRLVRGKRRTFVAPHGEESLTEACCLGAVKGNIFRWNLQPITGRSHQLRVEMANHGHVILGDKLYGSQFPWTQPGMALRAVTLDLNAIPESERVGLAPIITVPGLNL